MEDEESVDESTPSGSDKKKNKKSSSLIVQSMEDAIKAMDQSRRRALKKNGSEIGAEIPIYENCIQKLESDVRGHIKVGFKVV